MGRMRRQQELVFKTWGGARKGAGRKPRGRRASERHRRRPKLRKEHPVHVTLRVVPEVGRLRQQRAYRAAQRALVTTRRRRNFRICHLSLQGSHMHLIVEADNDVALAKGMQGFEISCAKHLNAAIFDSLGERRRGTVFPDRYHARHLTTPRQVRNALAYVLCNWRRHGEDRGSRARFDRFSTAGYVHLWSDDLEQTAVDERTQLLPVAFPRTWMLRRGWRKHGWLDPWERPGPI